MQRNSGKISITTIHPQVRLLHEGRVDIAISKRDKPAEPSSSLFLDPNPFLGATEPGHTQRAQLSLQRNPSEIFCELISGTYLTRVTWVHLFKFLPRYRIRTCGGAGWEPLAAWKRKSDIRLVTVTAEPTVPKTRDDFFRCCAFWEKVITLVSAAFSWNGWSP